MQDSIDALGDRQKASAGQAPPTLEELRAAFTPGDRLHPVPDDVLVTDVTAGGVPAHWLTAPGADAGRVLLFLHGGGYDRWPGCGQHRLNRSGNSRPVAATATREHRETARHLPMNPFMSPRPRSPAYVAH